MSKTVYDRISILYFELLRSGTVPEVQVTVHMSQTYLLSTYSTFLVQHFILIQVKY
jgi:hypothetical protein